MMGLSPVTQEVSYYSARVWKEVLAKRLWSVTKHIKDSNLPVNDLSCGVLGMCKPGVE